MAKFVESTTRHNADGNILTKCKKRYVLRKKRWQSCLAIDKFFFIHAPVICNPCPPPPSTGMGGG